MNTEINRQPKNDPYKPVSCDMSDELEAYSIQKTSLRIKVEEPNGVTSWMVGKVVDLFVKDHADYLKLSDGREVRLDKIIEFIPSTR